MTITLWDSYKSAFHWEAISLVPSQLSPLLSIAGSQNVLRDFAKRGFALWLIGMKIGPIISSHLITFSEM